MSARLEALAREKEVLLMRSALGRLKLRIAAEHVRRAPSVVVARRLASIVRIGRFLLRARA